MLGKNKKAVKKARKVSVEEPLKIEKTFEEAIRATMIAADKKLKKAS